MAAKGLPYTQAVWRVLQGAEAPMDFVEVAAAVGTMPVRESLNPERAVRSALRRSALVACTPDQRYVSVLWLLKGATFRHVLTEKELGEGSLRLRADAAFALYPFLYAPRMPQPPRPCHLYFEQGPLLSQPIMRFDGEAVGVPPTYALADWFEDMRCQTGDSLILEASDAEGGIYHVFLPSPGQQDAQRVAESNAQLAQAAEQALARKRAPCALFRLMPSLVAQGAYRNPCPPLPLETVLRSVPIFELLDRKVRMLPHAPQTMDYLPGLSPRHAESAKAQSRPGILKRLFGRKQ